MTTLIISPDFLSHFLPLSTLAAMLSATGERVVIATGLAMQDRARRLGIETRPLQLAPGSNDGQATAATFDSVDPRGLDQFIAVTRRGLVHTLEYQATKRQHELLWQPVEVGRRLLDIVGEIGPDRLVVDQVSPVSTLGALASGLPFVTVVPGHPTQLPVAGEVYGDAVAWPTTFAPAAADRARLRSLVGEVDGRVTHLFNGALAVLRPSAQLVDSAFRVHGDLVAYHWESDLHDPDRRTKLPASRVDLGPLTVKTGATLPIDIVRDGRPLVVAALGTFLSARGDVLATIAASLRELPVRVALAIGDQDPDSLGHVPADWFVDRWIPQVELLAEADLLISHGGNGSVQEALSRGIRQLVLPMSTDQFAIAADLERCRLAATADPNDMTAAGLTELVEQQLATPRPDPARCDVDGAVAALIAV